MSEHLLQSIKQLQQRFIHLQERLKPFLYMSEYLLQSIKQLQQRLIHLQEKLKPFL